MVIWYLKSKRETSNISTNHHENHIEKGSAQDWVLKFHHYLQNYFEQEETYQEIHPCTASNENREPQKDLQLETIYTMSIFYLVGA
jgi:hypothetical protein